ncbi:MAG: hypothetical protein SFY67_13375 [Candidatus Melainabacteria bacterium]|nr:hypothetical protein [Candidatus Melainabacteria bacterium]
MAERKRNLVENLTLAGIAVAVGSWVSVTFAPNIEAKQFELNAEQKNYTPGDNGVPEYAPYPTFTPQKPAKKQPPPKKQAQLKIKVEQTQQQMPPMQRQMPQARPMPVLRQAPAFNLGVTKSVPLPPSFLGKWAVQGNKTDFQAIQAKYQAANEAFAPQTQNTWIIMGNPQQGYAFSNDLGVKSPLIVDKVEGSRAFIKYQHQMKNTIAQEAIVLEVSPDGSQFNGMQRITIVKPGQGPDTGPRAKVTYQLNGFKQ